MLAVKLHNNAEQFLKDLAYHEGKTPEAVATETLEEWLENQLVSLWLADGMLALSSSRSFTITLTWLYPTPKIITALPKHG